MNFNTYLLEVRAFGGQVNKKPMLDARASGISTWFNSLEEETVPDVLVLNEIMSEAAERLMKQLCSNEWEKNNDWLHGKSDSTFIPCARSSHFAFATLAVNPTSHISPQKNGGVVVLAKRGHEITEAYDEEFEDCSGSDCWANKGFWLVHMRKGTQPYWIVGTHTNAYEGPENVAKRTENFKQIRKAVVKRVEASARLVYAGDMNIMTDPYRDENGNRIRDAVETDGMLQELCAQPAGWHALEGFWLLLDTPLSTSVDVTKNHYVHNLPEEKRLGNQLFDWILVPSLGDRLTAPKSGKFQVVPVQSDRCFSSDLVKGQSTDDLSDHYGVFAELCYADSCPGRPSVKGHRGATGSLPSGPSC
jgi:hypothetical protein